MTNERAIELLKRISDSQFDGIHGDERREALEIAVRALEGDGDTISRKQSIDTEGLDEQIRCEMCRNPMHTDRGCDGNCKYDEKLYERIMQILGKRIKPLSSVQPDVPDINVGDTIYRQQAIDALDKHIDTFDAIDTNYLCGLRTAMSILKEMPSAQPETHDKRTETHACDLISRRQAIEAFEPTHYMDWYTPTIIKTLEELPQAQQDKSCKGCHFEKHGNRACDYCSRMYMDRYEVRNDG